MNASIDRSLRVHLEGVGVEYSIQEVSRAAGTTSRTLRHYGELGLVVPSRIAHNGYRYYDERALVRLQRVLLLRELGLGLEAIGRVLEAQDREAAGDSATAHARAGRAEAEVLRQHLALLRRERERIDRQIGAVERTVAALDDRAAPHPGDGAPSHETKGDLMSQNMFEGFDHTQYREEVEERWGADAYAKSDRWWRGLGAEGQRDWQQRVAQLNADWTAAAERGEDPAGEAARALAQRHIEWLAGVPGRPDDLEGYVAGLAEMYVADERFAANYGGAVGAAFVRDALLARLAEGRAEARD